jgi:hypothetical protein
MKLNKIINSVLVILAGLLPVLGILMAIGSVGALECDNISLGQFFVQELIAFALFGLGYIFYIVQSYYEHFHVK